MNDKEKIQFANTILSMLKESKGDTVQNPKMIGTLNKAQGIKGFKTAEVGNPVFLKGDRYIIYLESLDGKTNIEVPYYKETLSKVIDFKETL